MLEPLGDRPGYRCSGNLAAQPEQHAADIRDFQGLFRRKAGFDGIQDHHGADKDHPDKNRSGNPHTPAVEHDSANHQTAENTQYRIAARVHPVPYGIPTEIGHGGILEQVRDTGEHVVEEERCEHRDDKTGKGQPAKGGVDFSVLTSHYFWILGSSRPRLRFLSKAFR